MAKNVFHPHEVIQSPKKVFIEPPKIERVAEPVTIKEEVQEYTGPSIEEIKEEAEAFKAQWEAQKNAMLEEARREAERIIAEAEASAFEEVRRKTAQAQKTKQEAEEEAQRIIANAQKQAAEIETNTQRRLEQIENEAFEKGYRDGHEQGYKAGKDEVERLIERLHLILSKAIEKRNEIIEESETELINLVLLIARKVIKVISENQKNVVINNVIQALRKLKSRGDVVIRVNLSDLELTTEHTKDFLKMVENVKSLTVMEDASVDKGGCIIETDFGQIDARISSQLREIEERIIELMPIKARGEE